MPRGDGAVGIILLALGVFVCQQAFLLSLGSARYPGPGFMAFGLGLILVILSIIYLFQRFHKDNKSEKGFRLSRPTRVMGAFFLLSFIAATLNWLGYLICTFSLFLIWLILIERKKVILSVGISILALIFIYFFNFLFSIQLPKGLMKSF